MAALFLLMFCASFVIAQQSQPAQPSPASQSQAPPQSSAPNGVHREGTDNILVDSAGIPLEDQSGKSIPPEAMAPPPNPAAETGTISVPS
ncbi:MAG: hypothetical protein DMG61_20850, partial [Acidobacteria bacterium]